MHFIGLMSGTSADAIDAALVSLSGDELDVIDYRQYPLDTAIRHSLRNVSPASSIESITELDHRTGRHFGMAARALLEVNGMRPDQVRAIGSHGQTVMHLPRATPPRTLQIGDPNLVAALTGITTIADFRRADMAAGGQGAPFAPAFHAWKFHSSQADRVVLNIGGIANITILPHSSDMDARGFDTGPGNTLMDVWIQQCQGRDYDEYGRWAAGGEVQQDLLDSMLADPYFSRPPPKSTGKDDFNPAWIAAHRDKAGCSSCRDEDVQATLLELTAVSIADAVSAHAAGTVEMLACGGGIHNPALVRRLQSLLPGIAVTSTGDHGIEPDAVEAVTFAWLARQRLENIPANLPSVTGAGRAAVLGAVYEAGVRGQGKKFAEFLP